MLELVIQQFLSYTSLWSLSLLLFFCLFFLSRRSVELSRLTLIYRWLKDRLNHFIDLLNGLEARCKPSLTQFLIENYDLAPRRLSMSVKRNLDCFFFNKLQLMRIRCKLTMKFNYSIERKWKFSIQSFLIYSFSSYFPQDK